VDTRESQELWGETQIYTVENHFIFSVKSNKNVQAGHQMLHHWGGNDIITGFLIRNLAVPRHFVSHLVFFLVFVWTQDPTTLLALKIRTPVANTGKLSSIGQMPVVKTPY
jgi:hypothetical protein